MPPSDLVIGWVVVPAVVLSAIGSVWAAVWSHLSRKALGNLESRLRREEDAFRLAHSPRVAAAIELWSASCEFERRLALVLSSRRAMVVPDGANTETWERAVKEQRQRDVEEYHKAYDVLTAARDKAEVLLPRSIFDAFDAMVEAYEDASDRREEFAVAEATIGPGHMPVAAQAALNKAYELRDVALLALHRMLGTMESTGR